MAVLGWKPRFLLRHSPDDLAVTEKGSRIPDDVPRWKMLKPGVSGCSEPTPGV
jgi:hypothetical protein